MSAVIGKFGDEITSNELVTALHVTKQSRRAVERFMEDYDVILNSTAGKPPWPIGNLDPSPSERTILKVTRAMPAGPLIRFLISQITDDLLGPIPNTPLYNLTGQPAISLLLHWANNGLPVGVQFAARYGDESTLFRLGAQLEEAQPWFHRRPPIEA